MADAHAPGGGAVPAVCAAVVTHDRRELLRVCLEALAGQTRPPDHVIVVDNACSDGTAEMVRAEHPGVELIRLPVNLGSSGGFHRGLAAAHASGATWAWVMDDDTIPEPTALERLLDAPGAPPGYPAPLLLCSRVLWTDGSLHPMNLPVLRREPRLYVEACAHGLLPIRTATFPSLLVHRHAIERFGLPKAHYFIWSDDWEYTARILRREPLGYLVPESVVEHRTSTAHSPVTAAGARYYFHVRNWLYMMRSDSFGPAEKLSLAFWLGASLVAYLRVNRGSAVSVRTVLRGVRDGLGREPSSSTA
jgi:rhamnopyranosyl-N-acetylglucosaminyl-diphospho-decaprenol beta-1,3/1,4-galactofuranosyltransferase